MAYFDQVNQKIEKNDLEIEGKNKKINELEEEGIQFRVDMASCTSKDKIIKLLEEKDESNKKLIKYLENMTEKQTKEIIELKAIVTAESEKALKCEAELISRNEKTKTPVHKLNDSESLTQEIQIKTLKYEKNKESARLGAKVNLEAEDLVDYEKLLKQQKEKRSCIASNSSEVHTVSICNTFEVLCDSDIAGPGWTVIQQRIGSGVDFYRDWNEYKNGFGDSWNQDFFLGLEKIHRLTNDQPHELYIHMQKFDGSTFFARYHEFAISCEDDQYRLSKLGGFSGTTTILDYFSYNKDKKFSTYDRDNDLSARNCAKLHLGGWWHAACTNT